MADQDRGGIIAGKGLDGNTGLLATATGLSRRREPTYHDRHQGGIVTAADLTFQLRRVGDPPMRDHCAVRRQAIGDYKPPERRPLHRLAVNETAPF